MGRAGTSPPAPLEVYSSRKSYCLLSIVYIEVPNLFPLSPVCLGTGPSAIALLMSLADGPKTNAHLFFSFSIFLNCPIHLPRTVTLKSVTGLRDYGCAMEATGQDPLFTLRSQSSQSSISKISISDVTLYNIKM